MQELKKQTEAEAIEKASFEIQELTTALEQQTAQNAAQMQEFNSKMQQLQADNAGTINELKNDKDYLTKQLELVTLRLPTAETEEERKQTKEQLLKISQDLGQKDEVITGL